MAARCMAAGCSKGPLRLFWATGIWAALAHGGAFWRHAAVGGPGMRGEFWRAVPERVWRGIRDTVECYRASLCVYFGRQANRWRCPAAAGASLAGVPWLVAAVPVAILTIFYKPTKVVQPRDQGRRAPGPIKCRPEVPPTRRSKATRRMQERRALFSTCRSGGHPPGPGRRGRTAQSRTQR
jgi:hypothetical protein